MTCFALRYYKIRIRLRLIITYRGQITMNVRRLTRKSLAIYFLFVFVFSSVISISHFSPYPDPAGLPGSNKADHHVTYALQPEDNDSDPDSGDDLAKLHGSKAFIHLSVSYWHLHPKPNYSFSFIGKNPLPPRSPPF